MDDEIQYSCPVEQLDEMIQQIDAGMSLLLTDAMKEEIELRRAEVNGELSDEYDTEDMSEAELEHLRRKKREAEKHRSHSHDVIVLDLTEEEERQLQDDMAESYIRKDPNSVYNISDEDLSSSEERRTIMRQLQSIGKCYYNQTDFSNAIKIIQRAIDYSLHHDYPWLTYEDARRSFEAGTIKFDFCQMPTLFMNFNQQITDPKILSGIAQGDIDLIDTSKQEEPKKKKKKKYEVGVTVPYTVISPREHEDYVRLHQMGYNTPISVILKSCSTIYNRYVMPMSFSFGQRDERKPLPSIDWTEPGAGKRFFEAECGVTRNPTTELISFLNDVNGKELNHSIGNGLKWFMNGFTPHYDTFKSVSTALQPNNQAVQIESRILDMIRMSNPNL